MADHASFLILFLCVGLHPWGGASLSESMASDQPMKCFPYTFQGACRSIGDLADVQISFNENKPWTRLAAEYALRGIECAVLEEYYNDTQITQSPACLQAFVQYQCATGATDLVGACKTSGEVGLKVCLGTCLAMGQACYGLAPDKARAFCAGTPTDA
eukprot:EG_transcript_39554